MGDSRRRRCRADRVKELHKQATKYGFEMVSMDDLTKRRMKMANGLSDMSAGALAKLLSNLRAIKMRNPDAPGLSELISASEAEIATRRESESPLNGE